MWSMLQHLLDQAEGASGMDPDVILDTVAQCHDGHQAVLDKQQEHLRWGSRSKSI